MDYNHLSNELEQASMFDLWRLSCIIDSLLDDPARLNAIKRHLQPGQAINYFESSENQLVEASVIQLKQKRVLVVDKLDGRKWNIPLYMVNLADVDTSIQPQRSGKLDRRSLREGDLVGWHSKDGNDKFGNIIKLNPKLAKIRTSNGEIWRVDYSFLSDVIEGNIADPETVLTIELREK